MGSASGHEGDASYHTCLIGEKAIEWLCIALAGCGCSYPWPFHWGQHARLRAAS